MRVIFKFFGGPLDGQTVVEQPGDPECPVHYYVLTNHGRVGQRFRTASEYAIETLAQERLQEEGPHRFQPHYYEVVDRVKNKGVLLVRADYVPNKLE